MQQKDMVQAEAVMNPELEHRLSPVVGGQELASAVIQDTVKYLGIQATGISHLNGPYIQVRPTGSNASDILLVSSWRAHYPPGGDGSGPILDRLQPVPPKPSATSLLGQTSGSDAGQPIQAAPSVTAEAAVEEPSLIPTPAAAVAAVPAFGTQVQGAGAAAAHTAAYPSARGASERISLDYGPGAVHAAAQPPTVGPGERKGPIIEEYHSDSEAASPAAAPRRPSHQHHLHGRGHHHHHHCREPGHEEQPPQPAEPIVQLAGSVEADRDRMMEDVVSPQPQQQAQPQGEAGQQPAAEGAPGGGGRYANMEGPGLAVAGALASAAAARAAASDLPRSRAIVPAAGPLVLSPRPRSEWELDPAKITIGRRLAVGGFGEVFLAKYEGTLVAVKRLLATDSDTTQRFVDEVHMLARLRHPNLLLFMGFTLTPEPSIVTEFMARGSLFHILRQAGNRPPEVRMQRAVAMAVARGMAYLHSRTPPILHLDLKSPNVLVDDRWRVKIADFGLSRVRQRTYVSSGAAAGSPEWMAPEVLRCDHYAEAADVYSFGVILWELLTGQAPWADLNAMQVVGAVGFAKRSLPDPAEGDAVLLQLCKACRACEPTQRPTFAQVVQSLEGHYQPLAAPAGNGPAIIAGADAAATPAPALPPTRAELGKIPLPALPAPESTAAAALPAERSPPAGPLTGGSEGRAGVAVASAPLAVGTASAATRITRRHSLAASPDANDLLVTAVGAGGAGGGSGGSFSSGGGPPRLDARFASVHESPRSRRRYRSPRGEDTVGPPAITARLQDGRKTPSPRTLGGWSQGAPDARASDAQPPAAAQYQGQGQQVAGAPGVRPMPANASPFAAVAASDFGPESIRGLRKLRVDSVRSNASGSDGGSVGSATREALVDGVSAADPQPMEVGSPPERAADPQPFAARVPGPTNYADLGVALSSAVPPAGGGGGQPIPELSGRPQGPPHDNSPHDHPQEVFEHRHQEEAQPLDNRYQHQVPWQADQQLPRQTEQRQAQPPAAMEQHIQQVQHQQQYQKQRQLQEQQQRQSEQQQQQQTPGDMSLTRQLLTGRLIGRPGHRRVNSDEANRLQHLHAAFNASTATGVSGAAGATAGPSSQQAQHQQQPQQRLMAAAGATPAGGAAGGSGALLPPPPPQVRRTRGLARNSAPMRYTYGGSSGAAGGSQQLPQLHSPPRPRSLHGPIHVTTMHQQVLTANAEAAMGAAAAQGAYQQLPSSAATPATPGGGISGSTAALSAPMSLSPISDVVGPFSEAAAPRSVSVMAELRERELPGGASGGGFGGGGGGAMDPWPDTHSELSFAFILRDNVSVCSDDYMQSASLDRLPLLEESEMTDPAGVDEDAITEGDPQTASDVEAEAADPGPGGSADGLADGVNADTDFELPRPFLSADQLPPPQLGAAKASSPFAAEATARPSAPCAPPASLQDCAPAPAPEADLWAALQSHSSGGLGRGASDHHLGSRANSGVVSPPPPRASGGSGGGCDATQPGCSLPHSRQSSDGSRGSGPQEQQPPARADDDQAPKTHPRMPNGGGATTYRSGRFKVTIEPAGSDPPPVQHSSLRQLNQQPQRSSSGGDGQQLQQHFLSLSQPRSGAAMADAAGAGCCADCSGGAAGVCSSVAVTATAATGGTAMDGGAVAAWPAALPSNGPLPAVAPVVPDPMSTEAQAQVGLAPLNCNGGAGAGGNVGQASPHGSSAGPVATSPLGESPGGTSARPRNGHLGHHSHGPLHGELAAGPPVALNSVTMYRKGRFFVSHAAAGTHSLSVINPNAAAACPASGCGGGSACTGVGGSGGCSATDSPAEESEEHDAVSGPSSPFASAAAAAAAVGPFGRVGSQTCMDNRGGSSAPVQVTKPTWAAVVAMGAAKDELRPGSISRQYSRGRFTVAESIVAAPSQDLRRPSSTSAGGDAPPATAAADGGASSPPLITLAAAATPPATAFAAPNDLRSGGSFLKSQPQPALQAVARLVPPQLSRLHTAASAGDFAAAQLPGFGGGEAGGSGSGCGWGGSAPSTVPTSPRADNVVVRRVGRFTVREVDGGSNASSRRTSNGGTPAPADASARGDLQPAGHAHAGATPGTAGGFAGRGGGSGGGAAAHGRGHGSPPEEGMVPSSHHSSCSFASASGCSRSSSASRGLDGDLLQPPSAVAPQQAQDACAAGQQPTQRVPQGPQQPGTEPHALKVLRIKSKGRFTVIDYEAPPPPPPQPLQQEEQQQQQPPAALPIAQQPGEGDLPGWAQQAAPLAPTQLGATPAAVAPSGSAGQPVETARMALHVQPLSPGAGEGVADAGTPHGGVLHPPSAVLPAAAGRQPTAAVASAPAGQASWGMSGPQAPEQRAQLQADMERLVRERMERNAVEQQRQELQGQGHGGRHRLGRPALGGGQGPQARQPPEASHEARERQWGAADGGSGGGLGGDRCTYEVSFGDGLTIQISHGLQAGGDMGEEGEDEDAVMVDVGIVHEGDDGEGGGSDSEAEGEGEGQQGEGRDGEGSDDELQPLQPPETPVHEPAHQREPTSWDPAGDEQGGGGRRRRRQARRRGGYGSGSSSDYEDSMEF